MSDNYVPRLKLHYLSSRIDLMAVLGYKNVMQVPFVSKIVINMGLSEGSKDKLSLAKAGLADLSGQRPVSRRSRKAIAGFKLRENIEIGAMVTLRGNRMYEFLDRFLCAVLPRERDFRGFSLRSFDGRGNYNFGLNDWSIFHEISYDKYPDTRGMDINVVTTAKNDKDAEILLKNLGFPFIK